MEENGKWRKIKENGGEHENSGKWRVEENRRKLIKKLRQIRKM